MEKGPPFIQILRELATPKERAASLYDLDAALFSNKGKTAVIVDIDVIVSQDSDKPSLKCIQWIEETKEKGFQLCITAPRRSLKRMAAIGQMLEVPVVCALWWWPGSFRHALEKLGIAPEQSILVSDSVLADIVIGNWLEIYTILTKPVHHDNFFDKLYYKAESEFLSALDKK